MKFHLVKCTACRYKCLKAVPVINDPFERARKYNNNDCVTFRKGEGIKLKVKVYAQNIEKKPNNICFCGSGKKFKKCHMKEI